MRDLAPTLVVGLFLGLIAGKKDYLDRLALYGSSNLESHFAHVGTSHRFSGSHCQRLKRLIKLKLLYCARSGVTGGRSSP